MNSWEESLLRFDQKFSNQVDVPVAVVDLLNGDFVALIKKWTTLPENCTRKVEEFIDHFGNSLGSSLDRTLMEWFLLGITCLCSFVQIHWTGPSLNFHGEYEALEHKEFADSCRKILSEGINHEEIFSSVSNSWLLLLSGEILVHNRNRFSEFKSIYWWSIRCLFIQQRITDNPSLAIRDQISSLIHPAEQQLASFCDETKGLFYTELALIAQYYPQMDFETPIRRAQTLTGLRFDMTGVLGKRTKFQQESFAQLVLKASSEMSNSDQVREIDGPREIDLKDDQLLSKTHLSNEFISGELAAIDQCILLAFCLEFKAAGAVDETTRELMLAYIERVLEQSNNWMIHSMALLLRSRLEIHKTRKIERALLQIQALVDQYEDQTTSVAVKMHYIYAVAFPIRWELEHELADAFLSVGAAASALQYFEKLQIWDSVVSCYRLMEDYKKAEELVRRQLEICPTPKLWCVLGDLTRNPEHYETAWRVSSNHYARAQRSLGSYYMSKGQPSEAVLHYESALSLNSLYPSIWFTLGCAYMNLEQWDKALRAFSFVVSISPEEGEAWNNMASIYIYMKRTRDAYNALKQALKHRFDNAKIWENFILVCMDLKEIMESVYAYHRLLDIKEKHVDLTILEMLVDAAIADQSSKIRKLVVELFGRITSHVTNNPSIWILYARLHYGCDHKEKASECHLRAYRALQTPGWEKNETSFNQIAKIALEIVASNEIDGSKQKLFQAKMLLQNLITRSSDRFQDAILFNELKVVLKRIETNIEIL